MHESHSFRLVTFVTFTLRKKGNLSVDKDKKKKRIYDNN
jgi:hypothetical protein